MSNGHRPDTVAHALQDFDARYGEEDLEGALEAAEVGLSVDDRNGALHHARGLVLWELGRHESAAEAMQRALDLDPALTEAYLDLALLLSADLGRPDEALRVLGQGRCGFREPALRAAWHAARARAWVVMDDYRAAGRQLRRARTLRPEDPELAVDLAEVNLEIFDLLEAEHNLDAALRLDPEAARAHWLRGVLLDRSGDRHRAFRAFERAAALAPEEHFVPERLTDDEFDRQVDKALEEITTRFRESLGNVEIAVEPYPSDELVRDHEVSPLVLGLFVGTPLTERALDAADLPPRILIFQRNLENVCGSRQDLIHEIGVTLRHEVGHLLGMDEAEIEDAEHG